MTSSLAFNEVAQALAAAGSSVHAAEAHGCLCGALCVRGGFGSATGSRRSCRTPSACRERRRTARGSLRTERRRARGAATWSSIRCCLTTTTRSTSGSKRLPPGARVSSMASARHARAAVRPPAGDVAEVAARTSPRSPAAVRWASRRADRGRRIRGARRIPARRCAARLRRVARANGSRGSAVPDASLSHHDPSQGTNSPVGVAS